VVDRAQAEARLLFQANKVVDYPVRGLKGKDQQGEEDYHSKARGAGGKIHFEKKDREN